MRPGMKRVTRIGPVVNASNPGDDDTVAFVRLLHREGIALLDNDGQTLKAMNQRVIEKSPRSLDIHCVSFENNAISLSINMVLISLLEVKMGGKDDELAVTWDLLPILANSLRPSVISHSKTWAASGFQFEYCLVSGQYQILKGIERIEAHGGEVQHIKSEAIIEGRRDLRGRLRARYDKWYAGGVIKELFPRLYALELHKHATVSMKLMAPSLDNSFRMRARSGAEESKFNSLLEIVQ
nr:RNA-directed DNA polymerase, eukaryota, reverse transcriptase zinc-binding domain protein [Tanacetum cinerariifolium]